MAVKETQTTTHKIENNRAELEALSETDLPAAELAEALLEVADGD